AQSRTREAQRRTRTVQIRTTEVQRRTTGVQSRTTEVQRRTSEVHRGESEVLKRREGGGRAGEVRARRRDEPASPFEPGVRRASRQRPDSRQRGPPRGDGGPSEPHAGRVTATGESRRRARTSPARPPPSRDFKHHAQNRPNKPCGRNNPMSR